MFSRILVVLRSVLGSSGSSGSSRKCSLGIWEVFWGNLVVLRSVLGESGCRLRRRATFGRIYWFSLVFCALKLPTSTLFGSFRIQTTNFISSLVFCALKLPTSTLFGSFTIQTTNFISSLVFCALKLPNCGILRPEITNCGIFSPEITWLRWIIFISTR